MDSRKGSGLGYDSPKTHDLSQGKKVPITGFHRTKNRAKNHTKIPYENPYEKPYENTVRKPLRKYLF